MISSCSIDIIYNDIKTQVFIPEEFVSDCRSLISSFKEELNILNKGPVLLQTQIEIYASFLKYCTYYKESIVAEVLRDFETRVLGGKNIHLVCNEFDLDKDQICTVLNGYFSAWAFSSSTSKLAPSSALVSSPSVKLMALFGGQPGTESYFDDISFMYRAYYPLVVEFVEHISSFLNKATLDPTISQFYKYGLDFVAWIDNPEAMPHSDYFHSSPVSIPLIGVSQLLQYMITFETLGVSPGELASSFKVAVGHSHGIITAAAISCSTTKESFYEASEKALGINIVIGAFGQLEHPLRLLDNRKDQSNGIPRPMVSVKGLSHNQLTKFVELFNNGYKKNCSSVYISVINTPEHFLVSGYTPSIISFVNLLHSECVRPDQDQSGIPRSRRKPKAIIEYTTITVSYHCEIYKNIIDIQYKYASDKGWVLSSDDMRIPVRANNDGHDIRNETDLTRYLFQSTMVLPVNWPVVIDYPGTTHIVDFGPGGASGFGATMYRNIEGHGILIICTSSPATETPEFGTRADLYKSDLSAVTRAPNWGEQYSPKLVRTEFDGKLHISTKMSRLLGKPPVVVSGMTLATVNMELITAIINSGYHIELACDYINNSDELNSRINKLSESIEPGCGITLNCTYSNPEQWSFQFPAIVELRRKGVPIEGLCIGGKVPPLEVATDIINTIRDVGIRHISLKPGSIMAIYKVVEIAQAADGFPVILQWNCNCKSEARQPDEVILSIIDTYRLIRRQSNISIVACFESGDIDGVSCYLNGEWSVQFEYAPMPFDGVLFRSQMMTSSESKANEGVKELVASLSGSAEIITENGKRVYSIANKCSLLWKELDESIFSVPRSDRLRSIIDKKDYIISHLNSDYMKPWFGTLSDGRIVDIETMTYIEVATRLVDLLYIKDEDIWIHLSYRRLFHAFLFRIEERFADINLTCTSAIIESFGFYEKIDRLADLCPDAAIQLLTSEDVKYFIELCKGCSDAPVPFIPVLDEEFEFWFKHGAVCQSEELARISNQDPQRVLILRDPISDLYSAGVDSPVGVVLDGVYRNLINVLFRGIYGGNSDKAESVGYLAGVPATITTPSNIIVENTSSSEYIFIFPENELQLPDDETWACMISKSQLNWIYALMSSPFLTEKNTIVNNTVRNVLRPRAGHTVQIFYKDNKPIAVNVTDKKDRPAVDVTIDDSNIINLSIHSHLDAGSTALQVCYQYSPMNQPSPFCRIDDKELDPGLVFFKESVRLGWAGSFGIPPTVREGNSSALYGQYIEFDRFMQYLNALGQSTRPFERQVKERVLIPIDYILVLAFPTLFDCITNEHYCRNVLNLVHQSNSIRLVSGTQPLHTGETVDTKSNIVSATNTTHGKQISIRTTVNRNNESVAEIDSTIFIRNAYLEERDLFSSTSDSSTRITFRSDDDILVFRSKEWVFIDQETTHLICPGATLQFSIETHNRYKANCNHFSTTTTGDFMLVLDDNSLVKVGSVEYIDNATYSNLVLKYLERFGFRTGQSVYFNDGGYSLFAGSIKENAFFDAPPSNAMYSFVSGDYIPIHTNTYIADYAGLPSMIVHGMHTNALTRSFIDQYAADGCPERVLAWNVDFISMVSTHDSLVPSFDHVGMKEGNMLVKGKTVNQHGDTVLEFTAEIEQLPTAYLFTGQGSQYVGMGMDLYERSAAARAVWDSGDKHMIETYGISILDIIRRNPTHHTVHFAGQKGVRIHSKYIGLIPGVDKNTRKYTFFSESGLLDLTQIIQPILALFDFAIIADMRENGLVQKSVKFAGHSFGEFVAVCAINEIFSLEDMLDIMFYRGLMLELAAECNERGYSEYRMAAVNPSRIGPCFTVESLVNTIKLIKGLNSGLLELINHNIEGLQYIMTGTISQLKALSIALDKIRSEGGSDVDCVASAVTFAVDQVADEKKQHGDISLERSSGFVPIENVHVPSHSSQMVPFVELFRSFLLEKLNGITINPSLLCSKYIPNIIGTPFEISQEYFGKVYSATRSVAIKTVLDKWDNEHLSDSMKRQHLVKTLFVELIANQIACPVQWIATQNHLLGDNGVERVIEIGPGPILSDMIRRSAKIMGVDIDVLSIATDQDELYFQNIDTASEGTEGSSPDVNSDTQSESSAIKCTSDGVEASDKPLPQTASIPRYVDIAASSEPIPDIPLDPFYVVSVIVAQKFGKPLQAITSESTIESLAGGKSTLRNEMIGDLKREFGSDLGDIKDNHSLAYISGKISSFSGALGPYTSSQISRLFKNKFTGSFNRSTMNSYLESTYGIGPLRRNGIFLMMLTKEPTTRLTSESHIKSWIGEVIAEYAGLHDIVIREVNVTSESGPAGNAKLTAADIQAFEKVQSGQRGLSTKIIEALANSIGIDLRKGDRAAESLLEKYNEVQRINDDIVGELGEDFINGVKPKFDPLKARRFDSSWNWARQDLLELFYDLVSRNVELDSVQVTEKVTMLKNRSTPALVDFLLFCVEKLKGDKSNDLTESPEYLFISTLYSECKESLLKSPVYISHRIPNRPCTIVHKDGNVDYIEIPDPKICTREDYISKISSDYGDGLPLFYMQTNDRTSAWEYDTSLTSMYHDALASVYGSGTTFDGKCALITGCGKDSIGEGILKGLLTGGAKVVATTSSYNRKTMLYFEDIYRRYGSRGAELMVVPFNQGSVRDIKDLVNFIYESVENDTGLGWELDFVFPFAALPNQFGDMTLVNSYSELSLRAMLTNIHRLLGEIATKCSMNKNTTRVIQAVIPLSPNQGQLGGYGLYSESKIGLETLLYRWYNEPWSEYMSVVGAFIGWTRGTALIGSDNNTVSMLLEEKGIYTFTTDETAACILCAVIGNSHVYGTVYPAIIELSGRFTNDIGVGKMLLGLKGEITVKARGRTNVNMDAALDYNAKHNMDFGQHYQPKIIKCRSNFKQQFPKHKSYDDLKSLHYMQGMVNLDKVVVVSGFGEVGPYGGSKTRWEMEAYGEFSLEGCVELAWVMGYIKFFNGTLKSTGKRYTGWVDSKTGRPVDDIEVKALYEKHILNHTGIRLIEPELHDGYDPNKKYFMRELQIEHDMEPFEASKEEAEHFKLQNDNKVDTWQKDDDTWMVKFLKGAMIMVPKAFQFDRTVAAQVPTGWDPIRYGIPEDIAKHVDPSVCYGLVATVEALLSSGITDPYELYSYFHVSKVGSAVGTGVTTKKCVRTIARGQLLDEDYPKDTVQEAIIGITAAWTNMLLLSSSGPIRPVSGACATSAISIDTAVEAIQLGKAKVMIAGGVEDYESMNSYEFGRIGATSSSLNDIARGRTPAEMSRPCTSTRNGFMEGEGAGIVVLMSASAAIEMGAPIYGIIALSSTATDKIGRSVPSPGQGILATVSESNNIKNPMMLDFSYRRAKLERHLQFIDQWESELYGSSESEIERLQNMRRAAQDEWGNEFWKSDSSISPLRGSLAVWGLCADDIGAISFHGTSTVLNDFNESEIFNTQFKHLGRTHGNLVPVITQKWLTGHSKGGAAAWMLNGLLQVLDTGLIPGNRNADNIEGDFEQFEYLVYPSKPIQTTGVRAGILKSFGFGQAGGEVVVVHSDYILAALSRDELEHYQKKVMEREKKVYRYWHDSFVENHAFVQVKDEPPFTKTQEQGVYLDQDARVTYDSKIQKYHF